jgi:hypothetical protein
VRALIGTLLLGTALAFPASAVAQLLSPNPTVLTLRLDGTLAERISGLAFSAMTPDTSHIVLLAPSGELMGPAAPGATSLSQQWILLNRVTGDRRVISINSVGAGQELFPESVVSGVTISISDDANRIVFNSTATNLDPAATSGANRCYLWDRAVGHAVVVDVDPLPGLQARPCGNITADGREVVALCSQPVPGVMGFGVCVRNLETGVIERLAPGRGAAVSNGYEMKLDISADGSAVLFSGWDGSTPRGLTRVDRNTGEVFDVLAGAGSPSNVSVSGDGRYVAFNIGVYDHVTGIRRSVARPPFATPTNIIYDLHVSRDGRFLAFRTAAVEFERAITGLPTASGRELVYRLDLATDRLEMVSRNGLNGEIANLSHNTCVFPDPFGCIPNRFSPRLSADGRLVVFQFPRANLAPSYPPGSVFEEQLFIKDMGPAAPLANPVPVPLDRRTLILGLGALLLVFGSVALWRRHGVAL